MLQINRSWIKATCVQDLSGLKGEIKSDIYEEEYPLIGKTYKLDAMFVMNELRDAGGRCIPRNPWEIASDIIKVHLFGWTSPEDVFGEPEGFDQKSFIYYEDSDKVYQWFKNKGINIRLPGYQDRIQEIYDKGKWRPKQVMQGGKKYAVPDTAESKSFAKMQKQECMPGGRYYDKPYYDLQVKAGKVIEPGKESKATLISIEF
jgi:hypothetical protein